MVELLAQGAYLSGTLGTLNGIHSSHLAYRYRWAWPKVFQMYSERGRRPKAIEFGIENPLRKEDRAGGNGAIDSVGRAPFVILLLVQADFLFREIFAGESQRDRNTTAWRHLRLVFARHEKDLSNTVTTAVAHAGLARSDCFALDFFTAECAYALVYGCLIPDASHSIHVSGLRLDYRDTRRDLLKGRY